MRLRPIAALVVAATVVGIGAAWWVTARQPVTLASGTALAAPRAIGSFRLTDHQGREFTLDALRGGWSLVFAGFTHCPDACPTTLALLDTVDRRLRARGSTIRVVFLSVDPARDTAERLAGYVGHFNPRFVGVTGARAQIDALCRDLGLAYVHNPGVGGDYTVDHSAALVLIDPRARVAGYFQPPHNPDALAADLAALADGAG
ncbi:MAG: SCO family protein [Gammaproteobacteria bacterium]|nr:SCO family protein [Gammaproteobacteria bacterium]